MALLSLTRLVQAAGSNGPIRLTSAPSLDLEHSCAASDAARNAPAERANSPFAADAPSATKPSVCCVFVSVDADLALIMVI